MAKKKDRVDTMVRIHPRIKQDFKTAILGLSLTDRARFREAPPTMELVTEALWRWFADLSRGEAEEFLAREFPKLSHAIDGFRLESPESEPDIAGRDAKPRKRKGRRA